jgi:hypothetical protein
MNGSSERGAIAKFSTKLLNPLSVMSGLSVRSSKLPERLIKPSMNLRKRLPEEQLAIFFVLEVVGDYGPQILDGTKGWE